MMMVYVLVVFFILTTNMVIRLTLTFLSTAPHGYPAYFDISVHSTTHPSFIFSSTLCVRVPAGKAAKDKKHLAAVEKVGSASCRSVDTLCSEKFVTIADHICGPLKKGQGDKSCEIQVVVKKWL